MQSSEQLVMSASLLPGLPRTGNSASIEPFRLEDLLRTESPRLLAFFARRVRPAEDAADLLSETLLVAWRRKDAIPQDETEARMWLFGVARKILSTHHRGLSRRNTLADRLREELAVSSVTARADGAPDDGVASSRIDDLHEALTILKAEERDLVALVHWDGFSLAEAAILLNQRPATIRSRYSRARTKLKLALDRRNLERNSGQSKTGHE